MELKDVTTFFMNEPMGWACIFFIGSGYAISIWVREWIQKRKEQKIK